MDRLIKEWLTTDLDFDSNSASLHNAKLSAVLTHTPRVPAAGAVELYKHLTNNDALSVIWRMFA